ncbi:MAG TPA: hypothetical protein VIN10_12695 [Bacteroidales bacterium]
MSEIKVIYEEFYNIDVNDHSRFVEFYKDNSLYFENKKTFTDYNDFICFTQVVTKFIIGLENNGRYQKTIEYADKYNKILADYISNNNLDLNDFNYYWSNLTSKGRAAFQLKDYKSAIEVFEELSEWDKENDYFKNWLKAAKHRKRNAYNKLIYIGALVFFLLAVLADDRDVSSLFLVSGFILALVASINDYIGNKAIKWSNE